MRKRKRERNSKELTPKGGCKSEGNTAEEKK